VLQVEIDRPDPITGWIRDNTHARVRFEGWLELISQFQRLVVVERLEGGEEVRGDQRHGMTDSR